MSTVSLMLYFICPLLSWLHNNLDPHMSPKIAVRIKKNYVRCYMYLPDVIVSF